LLFKKKVEGLKHVKYWNNADDLKAKAIQAISVETKRHPQIGWVRANLIASPQKIEELRQENDELRKEIELFSNRAPEGSDQYASGNEEYEITFIYKKTYFDEGDFANIKLSWNSIFSEVGPTMFEEAPERIIKLKLSKELKFYNDSGIPDDAISVEIDDSSFDTIKIQLFALGLIKKSDKKKTISDKQAYWTLTKYGEDQLLRMRAITKKQPALKKVASAE
jgi:hypothetical protein